MKLDYTTIHKESGWHEDTIKKSNICGCFNCFHIFSPNEINEWVNEDPKCPRGAGKTAICPNCGIDSVLPESKNYELNIGLLKKMHYKYF